MATLKELGLSPGFQVAREDVDIDRITAARNAHYLTVQDWCSAARINYASLYKWTAGKRRMKLETLDRAIMVFGLGLEDVLYSLRRPAAPRLHMKVRRGEAFLDRINLDDWDLRPLERERKRRGWTQMRVAEASGMSLNTIRNVLSEGQVLHRPISLRSVEAVAGALDIDVQLLRTAA